jgi:hypothetical protein
LLSEIYHHFKKLRSALLDGDTGEVKEFSADIANYCNKAFDDADRLCGLREGKL